MSIARNMITDVTEKQSATRDATENMLNAGSFAKVGLSLSSLKPPGKVEEVAKATVAMRAATTEHDVEVLMSHLLPFLTSSL